MYSFMKEELATSISERLAEEQIVSDEKGKAALRQMVLESIEDYFDGKIADVWTVDDVLSRAEESGMSIWPEQAREVLDKALTNFDAGLGISWDVIDAFLQEVAG